MYTRMYIINKEQLRFNHNKTPYELCFGRPTSFKHFRDFGRKCYKKRDDYKLGKFDSRSYEGIFLGYSSNKREYKCYNFRLHKILESANVKVDDLNTKGIKSQYNPQFDERIRDDDDDDDDDDEIKEIHKDESQSEEEKENKKSPRKDIKSPSRRIQRNHLESQILGNKSVGVETRRKLTYESEQAMLSLIETKTFQKLANIKIRLNPWIKSLIK